MKQSHSLAIFITSTIMSMTLPGSAHATQFPVNKTWTGLYGGIQGGYIFNRAEVKAQQLGFTNESNTCNGSTEFSSFFPGVQLGYDKHLRNNVVLGIEANVSFNLHQTKYYQCQCPINIAVTDSFTFTNRMQGSLRGRVGYALQTYQQSLLPYFIAGVSAARLGIAYSNEGGDYYSKTSSQPGWLAGAGLEWAFMQHWSVRAEYYYTDYGNAINMRIPSIYYLMDPNGQANMKLRSNNVDLALNYWM